MASIPSDSMPFELEVAQLLEMGFEDSTSSAAALLKVNFVCFVLVLLRKHHFNGEVKIVS